jgi:hypothetical protein
MGTSADFFVGRGLEAKWVGSIAYDGYPIDSQYAVKSWGVFDAKTEDQFRNCIREMRGKRDDFSGEEDGWPWSLGDSEETNYVYAFEDGKVYVYCNHTEKREKWVDCAIFDGVPLNDPISSVFRIEVAHGDGVVPVFPSMDAIRNISFSRTGLGLVTAFR